MGNVFKLILDDNLQLMDKHGFFYKQQLIFTIFMSRVVERDCTDQYISLSVLAERLYKDMM